MTPIKPTYQHLKPDGALFKCTDCGERKPHTESWYVSLPNGWKGVICNDCLDPIWKHELATFNPEPI